MNDYRDKQINLYYFKIFTYIVKVLTTLKTRKNDISLALKRIEYRVKYMQPA